SCFMKFFASGCEARGAKHKARHWINAKRQKNQNFSLTLFLRVEYNELLLVDMGERDLRLLHERHCRGYQLDASSPSRTIGV
ncbi:MAG: hypothetical protein WA125_02410, partial [Desulfosporosinus sp.]